MKNRITILDCTLRDGGYYTNWDFDRNTVDTYIRSFNQLPVEYLEIGYRSPTLQGYLGEYYYCSPHLLRQIRETSNKRLAIILNEKDVRPAQVDDLLRPCKDYVDMVRLAVDPDNFERALKLGEAVKALGFELSFNVMYMSKWQEYPSLLDNLSELDGLADYLYMVDSYGGVFPEDVRNSFSMCRERCAVPIGFHGHNNLELALINTLTAVECGAAIIDSTISGMGRGAGNLRTELLLTTLNATQNVEVDFNSLSEAVSAFEKLRKQYEWGANLPYMVSGANSLPQKQVMEWVGKRAYSFNSIIQALENQKTGQSDNRKFPGLSITSQYDTYVIIGGGPSAVSHSEAVGRFLKSCKNVCLIHASAKNAYLYSELEVNQYFCLIGNEGYRLERVFHDLGHFQGLCVLPPYPREMGTYVPAAVSGQTVELPSINFVNHPVDSHTAIALQLALNLGAREAFLVGYDGYKSDNISQRERELFIENEMLFEAARKHNLNCMSLVPTEYRELQSNSVYAKIQ